MYWWTVVEFWYQTTGWIIANYALQGMGQLLLLIILGLARWKEPAISNGGHGGVIRK